MINGNCSFERILEKFEYIPKIWLSFLSICVLWICWHLQCKLLTKHPHIMAFAKGRQTILKFLNGIAVCWSSPRFFQSPFPVSAGLVVSREARRPGRSGWKSHIFWRLTVKFKAIWWLHWWWTLLRPSSVYILYGLHRTSGCFPTFFSANFHNVFYKIQGIVQC